MICLKKQGLISGLGPFFVNRYAQIDLLKPTAY